MAIYHLSVKTISRSAGRSATAAAAYRSGVRIVDERTGEIHDYTRKGGIESTDLVLPGGSPDWAKNREVLWNTAEQAEKRKNSTVAREFEIALPAELDAAQRRALALDFAAELAGRHRCAVDVSIHAPGREGDNRNHHAHILTTTRRIGSEGMEEKCRELDDLKTGEVSRWRERWGALTNAHLERHGHAQRVDHRSHQERGLLPEMAEIHVGPTATAIERKGRDSERGVRNRAIRVARSEVIAARLESRRVDRQVQAGELQIEAEGRQQLKALAEVAQQEAQRMRQVKAAAARPDISMLPLHQVAQAWHQTALQITGERQKRVDRVLAKVQARERRRTQAWESVSRQAPEAPTGLLAAFKHRTHREAVDRWGSTLAKRRKLMEQAQKLVSGVSRAMVQASSWAYQKLRQSQPELGRKVDAHEQAERVQLVTRQREEREARRSQSQDRGWSR